MTSNVQGPTTVRNNRIIFITFHCSDRWWHGCVLGCSWHSGACDARGEVERGGGLSLEAPKTEVQRMSQHGVPKAKRRPPEKSEEDILHPLGRAGVRKADAFWRIRMSANACSLSVCRASAAGGMKTPNNSHDSVSEDHGSRWGRQ